MEEFPEEVRGMGVGVSGGGGPDAGVHADEEDNGFGEDGVGEIVC